MLKKYIIVTFFWWCSVCVALSQDDLPISLQSIQGIWSRINLPEYTNNTSSITINKGFKSLNFEYGMSEEAQSYIVECYIGFQNSSSYSIDTMNIKNLKESGNHYTEILMTSIDTNGLARVPDFSTPEIISLDENSMWINYGKVSMYEKIERLPDIVLQKLFYCGKRDHRDYLKEYLDIKVIEITSKVCNIYSEDETPTKQQLNKGDVVTVMEEKRDWLKVEFDEGKTGWIKKKDTK